MTKWFISFLLTIIANNFLFAQQSLEIKGVSPDLYLEHTVSSKETLYSVARLYNSSPRELAAYNHLTIQSGLKVGENLKIPLDKNNFIQSGTPARNEAFIPVYHTVTSGETLYRLGVNYNKVPLPTLKKWNHLSSDEVTVGASMVVGHLKVDKTQSALAKQSIKPATEAVTTIAKPEIQQAAGQSTNSKNTSVSNSTATTTEKSGTVAKTTNEPAATPSISVCNKGSQNLPEGYFKNLYNQQTAGKNLVYQNGNAGVFKSTSGWQDGKYYCFYNNAAPGDIIKITNSVSRETVYAKVLDAIPDIKQNAGLLVVISNAAANGLGVGEDKFTCTISYSN